jgi:excinuclease ABC subunit C
MAQSALDDIPGLGELRRKAILRTFGSVKRLRAATVDEIAEVPGVGRRTAEAVHRALADAPAPAPAVDPATGEIIESPPETQSREPKSVGLRPDTDPLRVGGSEPSP